MAIQSQTIEKNDSSIAWRALKLNQIDSNIFNELVECLRHANVLKLKNSNEPGGAVGVMGVFIASE